MKSGQRATKADTGGQRLPDAPKAKSPGSSQDDLSQSQKNNVSSGGQPKAAKKK